MTRISLSAPDAKVSTQVSLPAPEHERSRARINLAPAKRARSSPKKRTRFVTHSFTRKRLKIHHDAISPYPISSLDGIDETSYVEGGSNNQEPAWSAFLNQDDGQQLQTPLVEPSRTTVPVSLDESPFAIFVDTVLSNAVSLIQICNALFVVQGWDLRYNMGTVRITRHLRIAIDMPNTF